MENIWIKNIQSGEMLNLRDCVRVTKRHWRSSRDENEESWYVKIEWIKYDGEVKLKSEKERDNFHAHIESLLKPEIIDPEKKPIKL